MFKYFSSLQLSYDDFVLSDDAILTTQWWKDPCKRDGGRREGDSNKILWWTAWG